MITCTPWSWKIRHKNNISVQDVTILINDTPDTLIANVGDEILFQAYSEKNNQILTYCQIQWNFGDCIIEDVEGLAATHTYIRPGTYNVSTAITNTYGNTTIKHSSITIEGVSQKLPPLPSVRPVIELKFENNLNDTSGNNHNGEWGNGPGTFVSGIEGRAMNLSDGNYCMIRNTNFLNNLEEFTISFWAKKNSNTELYFFDKIDTSNSETELEFWLRYDARYIGAKLRTTEGTGHAYTYDDLYGFRNNLWHHYTLVYDGSVIKIYIDGKEVIDQKGDCPRTHSGNLNITDSILYIGTKSTRHNLFPCYIDEFKIYNKALTWNEMFCGFELWHADFHSRTAQYLFVQIPGDITKTPTNKIHALLTGDNGVSCQLSLDNTNTLHLVGKNNFSSLKSEEKILLRNSTLPGGFYSLTVSLTDGQNNTINSITKKINKPYDGYPKVGIDENNSIVILKNGTPELFFPVTPWGLNNEDVIEWGVEKGYINTLLNQGYYPDVQSVNAWNEYINIGVEHGIKAIGPTSWDGKERSSTGGFTRNSSIIKMKEYITASLENDAMLFWHWDDEPDLGGESEYVPSTVVRAWTRICHESDPHHPVATNFAGQGWTKNDGGWWVTRRKKFAYLHNTNQFGAKTPVVDVLGFDYYPIEWNYPDVKRATMTIWLGGIDNIIKENYNLLPFMSFIETTDIYETSNILRYGETSSSRNFPTPYRPSPEQLKMMCWANVVYGVKGLNWFHYRIRTLDENYTAMAQFKSSITDLKDVVLGPDIDREITVTFNLPSNTWNNSTTYNAGQEIIHNGKAYISIQNSLGIEPGIENYGNPNEHFAAYWKISRNIKTMIREHENKIYIFAVRLTEIGKDYLDNPNDPEYNNGAGSPKGYAISVGPVMNNVQLSVSGTQIGATALVLNESRSVSINNNIFSDTFNLNDVHIYIIE